jgi:hypothetical protein
VKTQREDAPTVRAYDFYATPDPTYGRETAVRDASPTGHRQTPDDREAILTSLYAERSTITRMVRLNTATAYDRDYLADVERTIAELLRDELSSPEVQAHSEKVWSKIEELADSLVALQAKVEAQRPK